MEKSIFLYFLTHFNLLDFGQEDFWAIAIYRNTLQQVVRDNFVILQTSKIYLFKASLGFQNFSINLPQLLGFFADVMTIA